MSAVALRDEGVDVEGGQDADTGDGGDPSRDRRANNQASFRARLQARRRPASGMNPPSAALVLWLVPWIVAWVAVMGSVVNTAARRQPPAPERQADEPGVAAEGADLRANGHEPDH